MTDTSLLPLVAGIVALTLFAGLALFQLALAVGAPWGRAAYGGQNPGVLPARLRVASLVAAAVWVGVGLIVARRGGVEVWAPLPDAAVPIAVWVVVGLLVIAVVANAISRSRIERAIWVPATLLMLTTTVTVALTAS